MKKIFSLALAFTAFVSVAQANCNPEAEFIGTATDVTQKSGYYTYKISLRTPSGSYHFYSNVNCPLFPADLQQAVIKVPGKAILTDGDLVSGVLVLDNATGEYHVN